MRIARREWVLENDGEQIFGVLHSPLEVERPPAIVIFHGLLGSKDQPHQLFVKLADALVQAGIVALRIDFRGRGDSEGDSVEMTPHKDIADARKALDCLEALSQVDAERLGVLGLSWGGAIAVVAMNRNGFWSEM
jgi:uncharacterized protein